MMEKHWNRTKLVYHVIDAMWRQMMEKNNEIEKTKRRKWGKNKANPEQKRILIKNELK